MVERGKKLLYLEDIGQEERILFGWQIFAYDFGLKTTEEATCPFSSLTHLHRKETTINL